MIQSTPKPGQPKSGSPEWLHLYSRLQSPLLPLCVVSMTEHHGQSMAAFNGFLTVEFLLAVLKRCQVFTLKNKLMWNLFSEILKAKFWEEMNSRFFDDINMETLPASIFTEAFLQISKRPHYYLHVFIVYISLSKDSPYFIKKKKKQSLQVKWVTVI